MPSVVCTLEPSTQESPLLKNTCLRTSRMGRSWPPACVSKHSALGSTKPDEYIRSRMYSSCGGTVCSGLSWQYGGVVSGASVVRGGADVCGRSCEMTSGGCVVGGCVGGCVVCCTPKLRLEKMSGSGSGVVAAAGADGTSRLKSRPRSPNRASKFCASASKNEDGVVDGGGVVDSSDDEHMLDSPSSWLSNSAGAHQPAERSLDWSSTPERGTRSPVTSTVPSCSRGCSQPPMASSWAVGSESSKFSTAAYTSSSASSSVSVSGSTSRVGSPSTCSTTIPPSSTRVKISVCPLPSSISKTDTICTFSGDTSASVATRSLWKSQSCSPAPGVEASVL
mmetsp:Transcript_17791/g.45134  ORF Transcript_17791/g.45134 Transcript_17791/m.45134 type:complete len:336 (+) Transcript_17791:2326-3333(+)